MKRRYRILLPIIFGAVSLCLMIWDFYNSRTIQSVGMGWDTGAPLWPYQASFILLLALNTPAFIIAVPFLNLLHAFGLVERYFVLFPVILAWWHFVGVRLDFGLLGLRHYSRPLVVAAIFFVSGFALFILAGQWTFKDAVWISHYGWNFWLILRSGCVEFWAFILGTFLTLAGIRVTKHYRLLKAKAS